MATFQIRLLAEVGILQRDWWTQKTTGYYKPGPRHRLFCDLQLPFAPYPELFLELGNDLPSPRSE
jgi:hypothetical protein